MNESINIWRNAKNDLEPRRWYVSRISKLVSSPQRLPPRSRTADLPWPEVPRPGAWVSQGTDSNRPPRPRASSCSSLAFVALSRRETATASLALTLWASSAAVSLAWWGLPRREMARLSLPASVACSVVPPVSSGSQASSSVRFVQERSVPREFQGALQATRSRITAWKYVCTIVFCRGLVDFFF